MQPSLSIAAIAIIMPFMFQERTVVHCKAAEATQAFAEPVWVGDNSGIQRSKF